LDKFKKERDILKSLGRLFQTELVKYLFIEKHWGAYQLTRMCKILGVSRSGYDAWRKLIPSKRGNENERLLGQIQEIYQKNRRI
jgi:putative transposase